MKKIKILVLLLIVVVITVSILVFNNREEDTVEVVLKVPNFSTMKYEDAKLWCKKNLIDCDVTKEYSNVKFNKLISQSIEKDTVLNGKEKIIIKYSNGNEPTDVQKQLIEKAKKYSDLLYMSKKAIYEELIKSDVSEDDAKYVVNHLDVDFKENALKKAKEYKKANIDESKIYENLISSLEQFTSEEAKYAIDNLEY